MPDQALRLICPQYRLPGTTMSQKWEQAASMGFDGIELSGPATAIAGRLAELHEVRRDGAVFPTVSGGGRPFIGELDPEARRAAVTNMKQLLSAIAELGGLGAMTPACFGVYSNALPSLKPRDEAAGRETLIEALAELGQHAESCGVILLLEPLNRYEDHHINRLDQALELIKAAGSPSVKILADIFHMNIEEADPAAAIRRAGAEIKHVQLADTNRLEPGAGHLEFTPIFHALKEAGFTGYCALECRLSADPHIVLPRVVNHLRAIWSVAGNGGTMP